MNKTYKNYLALLSLMTIIQTIVIYIIFGDVDQDVSTSFVFFLALGFPVTFICIVFYLFCIFYIIKHCFRMRDKWQKCFVAWVVILVLLLPAEKYLLNNYMDAKYGSAIFHLPDGRSLTVSKDKMIFGDCDDIENPKKNYIEISDDYDDYSIALTHEVFHSDSLYIWTCGAIPAKVHQLGYPVAKIYSGSDQKDIFMKAIGYKLKWMYSHEYMLDGIHSGGSHNLIYPIDRNRLKVESWDYTQRRYVGRYDVPRIRTASYDDLFGK